MFRGYDAGFFDVWFRVAGSAAGVDGAGADNAATLRLSCAFAASAASCAEFRSAGCGGYFLLLYIFNLFYILFHAASPVSRLAVEATFADKVSSIVR